MDRRSGPQDYGVRGQLYSGSNTEDDPSDLWLVYEPYYFQDANNFPITRTI